MENTVEVRYAGVVVGRTAMVRDRDPASAFVTVAEPLPVGTTVTLRIGDTVEEARVVEVVESADPAVAGMRVRFGAPASAPAASTPVATAPAAAPPAGSGASAPDLAPGGAASASAAPPPGTARDVADDGDVGAVTDEVSGAVSGPNAAGESGPQPGGGGGGRRRRRRR